MNYYFQVSFHLKDTWPLVRGQKKKKKKKNTGGHKNPPGPLRAVFRARRYFLKYLKDFKIK